MWSENVKNFFFFSADKPFHSSKRFIHSLINYTDVLRILGKPEPWLIMFKKCYRQLLKFCGVPQSRAAVSPVMRSSSGSLCVCIRT